MDICITYRLSELITLSKNSNFEELKLKYYEGIKELLNKGYIQVISNDYSIISIINTPKDLAKYFIKLGLKIPVEHTVCLESIYSTIIKSSSKNYISLLKSLVYKLNSEGCTINYDKNENIYKTANLVEEINFKYYSTVDSNHTLVISYKNRVENESKKLEATIESESIDELVSFLNFVTKEKDSGSRPE